MTNSVLLEVGIAAMRTLLHKRSGLAEVFARRRDEHRRQNEERVRIRSTRNTGIGARQSDLLARILNVFSLS